MTLDGGRGGGWETQEKKLLKPKEPTKTKLTCFLNKIA